MMIQRVVILKDHEELHWTWGITHVPPSVSGGHHGAEFTLEFTNFGVGGSWFGPKGGEVVWW